MDFTIILGVLGGLAVILYGVRGPEQGIFFVKTAEPLIIVIGGTIAATLIHIPINQIIRIFGVLKAAFSLKRIKQITIINQIVEMAKKAKKEGFLALEGELGKIQEPFLHKGITLVMMGEDAKVIEEVLQRELTALEERHDLGQAIFSNMAKYSPSFGLIGTVAWLVLSLAKGGMQDPAKIGVGIAEAMKCTFFGILMSYLVYLPIAGRLKIKSQEEIINKEMMIIGVLAIKEGVNPSVVQEKLSAFLSPRYRRKLQKMTKGE